MADELSTVADLDSGGSLKFNHALGIALLTLLVGCDTNGEVEILPLPPLERPTPEALMGLPEVSGRWRFAGWEVDRPDTTALEAAFPRFGDLVLDTQRLDSIAGSFVLAGGAVPVVGEVRKEGTVAMVTYADRTPGSFVTGRIAGDTLWLELTSIIPPQDWPRDARAAFVRAPVASPIAWLRGANPNELPPPLPVDSGSGPGRASAEPTSPPARAGAAATDTASVQPTSPRIQAPPTGPAGVRRDQDRPLPPGAGQAGPGDRAPEAEPSIEPEVGPEPEPELQPEVVPPPSPPVLLGEPVDRDNR